MIPAVVFKEATPSFQKKKSHTKRRSGTIYEKMRRTHFPKGDGLAEREETRDRERERERRRGERRDLGERQAYRKREMTRAE